MTSIGRFCSLRLFLFLAAMATTHTGTVTAQTVAPTKAPTARPTAKPTKAPTTAKPTKAPTTAKPTKAPTTAKPTKAPTTSPTLKLTTSPTSAPTILPTLTPTGTPTPKPTPFPTSAPTSLPTLTPTGTPTPTPTPMPTGAPSPAWSTKVISIDAGFRHSCAILDNMSLKCWGEGYDGQLGQGNKLNIGDGPGEMGGALPAINLGTSRTALAISAGWYYTCALLDDHTVKCWGNGEYGQLGQGSHLSIGDGPGEMGDALPAINLGTGRTALAVSAGYLHTCALLDNHAVKCWGNNWYGQLGQGSLITIGDDPGEMGDALPAINLGTGRTALAVSAGEFHTCVLLDDHTVKCWGYGEYGQLGQGSQFTIGDDPGETGDALPAINLGTGRTALAISAAGHYTCAVLDNLSVKCWGDNYDGQISSGLSNVGDGPGQMGDNLPAFNFGSGRTALAISAGRRHICALLNNYAAVCWGTNGYAQLGRGNVLTKRVSPGQLVDFLTIPLGASGDQNSGDGRTVSSISAGTLHTCAVLDPGTVKCWGYNFEGEAGQGTTSNIGDNPSEMNDFLPGILLPDYDGKIITANHLVADYLIQDTYKRLITGSACGVCPAAGNRNTCLQYTTVSSTIVSSFATGVPVDCNLYNDKFIASAPASGVAGAIGGPIFLVGSDGLLHRLPICGACAGAGGRDGCQLYQHIDHAIVDGYLQGAALVC